MITRSVFTSKLQSINNLELVPNPETAADVAAKANRLCSNLIYNNNNNNENKYNHGNR